MGLFDRFKKGLTRTREKLATGMRSVLRIGQRIDEETLHRLENVMLAADFGPTTTAKLIEVVRSGWKSGEIAEEQQVTEYLRRHVVSLWSEADCSIRFAVCEDAR